jgi:hypothetical protein
MRTRIVGAALLSACATTSTVFTGCSKPPSAMGACQKLQSEGVASGCREDKPGGPGAAATEEVVFDLPSLPGKTGQVMLFPTDEAYNAAVKAFEAAAFFAGPHRYGSAKTHIFVQMDPRASLEVGKKAKAVIEGL